MYNNNLKVTNFLVLLAISISNIVFFNGLCHAQNIVFDNSISQEEVLKGPNYLIQQSKGKSVNNKLFHSFKTLNLKKGESISFESLPAINYIFTRVTGGKLSTINGSITTLGNNVDLFILNPQGIIFGPDSSLNINGSFFATTGESILFSHNDVPFSASQPSKVPNLSISTPIGIQFGRNPGSIVNKSIFARQPFPFPGIPLFDFGLEGKPNNTLALIGGDVLMKDAFITAPNGNIILGSVSDFSTVSINNDSSNSWRVTYDKVSRYSDVLLQNSQISTTGLESGSGSTEIQGHNLSFLNQTQITAFNDDSPGRSGDITLGAAQKLSIKNGSSVQIRTFGNTPSGNISITANTLDIDSVVPNSSARTGIFTTTTSGSSESAGGINIIANNISLNNEGNISVDSNGSGVSGNITIQGSRLLMNNSSSISATSSRTDGGNITLKLTDFLFMQGQSLISASAGTPETPGDGGNINIFANFVIGIPNSNSDIIATSFQGKGGLININARRTIFGFQELEDINENNLNPRNNLTNDIAAVSLRDPNLNGQVNINSPDVDPSENISELPEVVEPTPEVAQGCRPGQAIGGSSFIHTGRGGLPPGPHETQTPTTVWQDLRTHNLKTPSSSTNTSSLKPPISSPEIVEARGWFKDSFGRLHLTANVSQSSYSPLTTSANC